MLIALRNSLISEALSSPNLLADLAGLEQYIAESYNNRSFIELLQNADDANSSKFLVEKVNDALIVANNGRIFNDNDIESLCRSAASHKTRGTSIGYRGVGFKSVVNFANEVHLISGDYAITFSREKTKEIIKSTNKVPLLRIPHDISTVVMSQINNHIVELKSLGYSTFFIFTDLVKQSIEAEFSTFCYESMLFLNNVTHIDIKLNSITRANVNRNANEVKLLVNDKEDNWLTYNGKGVSIALHVNKGHVEKLNSERAKLFSFLPTEDCTETGAIFNGDFSTDPSRRHLIYDDVTEKTISNIAELYLDIINERMFSSKEFDKEIISALMPISDLRMSALMKNRFLTSFGHYLIDKGTDVFNSTYINPDYLNADDFKVIVGAKAFHKNISEVSEFRSFAKSMHVSSPGINDIIQEASNKTANISIQGHVETVVEAIRQSFFKEISDKFFNEAFFYSDSKPTSINDCYNNGKKIDNAFLELLIEKGLSKQDLISFFKKLNLLIVLNESWLSKEPTATKETIQNKEKVITDNPIITKWFSKDTSSSSTTVSVNNQDTQFAWRRAEVQVMEFLNSNGFNLSDVSKSNLGYDLFGNDPNGNEICIEVKSLKSKGESFVMTNNEYALAELKGKAYFIVLAIPSYNGMDFGMIQDPVKTLKFERRAVQWVWDCSIYEYISL